jgi:hypothetical protein
VLQIQGFSIVQEEPSTVAWFGIRSGTAAARIFDAFRSPKGTALSLS